MKLARIGPIGAERPAVEHQDAWYDISSLVPDIDPEFFAHGGIDSLKSLDHEGLPTLGAANTRFGPCVARTGKVICIGLNYADHAAESGVEIPAEPTVFMKAPNTISGPNDEVLMPPGETKVDWELELAVVIGREARYLDDPSASATVIAGYAISNDVSERIAQLERGGQWTKGKSFETFNPLGPWLITPDELDIDADLAIELAVNGETFQSSTTGEMVFDPNYIVWYLSQFMVLEPGDIVNTGTPAGVGLGLDPPRFLAIGDRVESTIAGLGTQSWAVTATPQ